MRIGSECLLGEWLKLLLAECSECWLSEWFKCWLSEWFECWLEDLFEFWLEDLFECRLAEWSKLWVELSLALLLECWCAILVCDCVNPVWLCGCGHLSDNLKWVFG